MERKENKTGSGREQQKTGSGRQTHRTGEGRRTFRTSELHRQIRAEQEAAGQQLAKLPKKGFLESLRGKAGKTLSDWLIENTLPSEPAVVLEAGCGAGETSGFLAASRKVKVCVGVDIKMERLLEAKARDSKLALVRADLFRLPFKPGTFDLVFSHSTLEHIHDKRRVVYEMVHAAKVGGRVFLGVPYQGGPLSWLSWLPGATMQKKIGNLFDEQSLAVDIEGTGLVLEGFTTYHHKMFLGCLARKEQ